ncbi:MAG TPA: AmmeMemoRadiSam system protein B [Thiobacillaceae bacterium]|nr:AmmeMemoRadiSam system protein B [Thiobacillaceae bacterium]
MHPIRPPAVAGMFYPGESAALARDVQALLGAAKTPTLRPKALIAPHAGYVYSGPVAASAYALLKPLRQTIKRVVLLGPLHRVWVAGLALPSVAWFDTPLGRIPLDTEAMQALSRLPQVEINDAAHAAEHSLEVHLPFLQTVLEDFKLVPLAVGGATPEGVAQALDAVWGGDETLIVVSSDLSHYLPYAQAQTTDQATVQAMLDLDTGLRGEQACGAHPVNGLDLVARRRGLKAHLLDLRNSGDTAGDKSRVVGYAALAFTEPEARQVGDRQPDEATESQQKGRLLTALARSAIAGRFGKAEAILPRPDWLQAPGAVFVTLTQNGQLRGCIGSLQARRPLGEDLEANAQAAAFRDPRFAPLTEEELDRTHVEVSILSPPQAMRFTGEADALEQLRPGVDGVILEYGSHRATFLPQVWSQLPDKRVFMAHLKQKAGLLADFWADDVRLYRYTVEKYKE